MKDNKTFEDFLHEELHNTFQQIDDIEKRLDECVVPLLCDYIEDLYLLQKGNLFCINHRDYYITDPACQFTDHIEDLDDKRTKTCIDWTYRVQEDEKHRQRYILHYDGVMIMHGLNFEVYRYISEETVERMKDVVEELQVRGMQASVYTQLPGGETYAIVGEKEDSVIQQIKDKMSYGNDFLLYVFCV